MSFNVNGLNDLVAIASLVVSLVALIISVIALKISKDVVVYASKDYEPQLEVTISDESEVRVINKSKRLFDLIDVSFIRVKIVGFEDYENKIVVHIPLLVLSKHCSRLEGKSEVLVNENSVGPCAFQQCPLKENFVKMIEQKIHNEYMAPYLAGSSQKGYAFPSFQSESYYVSITYENKFQERKYAYFNKHHYHGTGYVNSKVSEKDLESYLKYIDMPKFDDFDRLWNYLIERYKIPSNQFWGR